MKLSLDHFQKSFKKLEKRKLLQEVPKLKILKYLKSSNNYSKKTLSGCIIQKIRIQSLFHKKNRKIFKIGTN